ncbi:MAG: V-type ATP synthase subunit E family protein [Deltaproteobacteria bacterium]
MGIEKIRESVLSGARKEAANIIETAKKHAASLMNIKKEEIASEADRLYTARTSAIADEFNRKLIQFKGMAGKQVLERRNQLLNTLFEKAGEMILNWPAEKYGLFMAGLIEKTARDSGGKLRVHRDEEDIFTRILSDMNKKRSPETRIVLDDSNPLTERGGFIFVGTNYEVDQTLGLLLKDIKQEMLPIMAKELFSA